MKSRIVGTLCVILVGLGCASPVGETAPPGDAAHVSAVTLDEWFGASSIPSRPDDMRLAVRVDLDVGPAARTPATLLPTAFAIQTDAGLSYPGSLATPLHPMGCREDALVSAGGYTSCVVVFDVPETEAPVRIEYVGLPGSTGSDVPAFTPEQWRARAGSSCDFLFSNRSRLDSGAACEACLDENPAPEALAGLGDDDPCVDEVMSALATCDGVGELSRRCSAVVAMSLESWTVSCRDACFPGT